MGPPQADRKRVTGNDKIVVRIADACMRGKRRAPTLEW
jgi:hypothetical protein